LVVDCPSRRPKSSGSSLPVAEIECVEWGELCRSVAMATGQRCWLLAVVSVALLMATVAPLVDAFCPVGCLCDDETLQVTCDDVNLEVIPITLNPSVQRLVLRRNKIKSVDSALRFYLELFYIDFSHNKLVSIQNHSFDAQRKLTELRLDFNKISFVNNGTWSGLRELTILSLRDNFVQNLDARAFATAPRIRELDLGQNRLEHIHPDAFAGLPDLRNLYLDDNRLNYASATGFPAFLTPLSSLAELNLASNELPWLADRLFTSTPHLSVLDLSGCNIRNISTFAFQGLGQLRTLKLHDNLLRGVPTAPMMLLTHVEHLTLGQNQMTSIPAHAFLGLTKLQQLDINSANQLTSIDARALSANSDLQSVQLVNCKKLSSLPDHVFSHSANLRRLSLRDNGLVSVPNQLAPWSQLDVVDLSGNPFNCKCDLLWLRNYLREMSTSSASVRSALLSSALGLSTTSSPSIGGTASALRRAEVNPSDVVCATPLSSSSRSLHSLSDEQLGCRTALNSKSVLIAVSATGGVLLLLLTFLLWRFRRRIRRWCSKPPHPKSSSSIEDDGTLDKWRPPPSPPSWGTSHNNVSLIANRTPDYHKACSNEEECFMRAVTLHNTLKPFPRTEL